MKSKYFSENIIPDFAIGFVARHLKTERNAHLEQFLAFSYPVVKFDITLHAFQRCFKAFCRCNAGIIIKGNIT